MHPAARAGLRWVGALLGLALVVAYAVPAAWDAFRAGVVLGGDTPAEGGAGDGGGGAGAGDGDQAAEQVAPVSDGSQVPAADFVVRNGRVTDVDARTMSVSSDGDESVVLAFDRIGGDLECLDAVTLEAQVVEADATEITVHASSLFDAAGLGDGAEVGGDPLLAPQPRQVAYTNGTPGYLEWDVTDVYRAAVDGEGVPDDGAAVLLLRPTGNEGSATVEIAAVDAGQEDAPRLSWTGVDGCGEQA